MTQAQEHPLLSGIDPGGVWPYADDIPDMDETSGPWQLGMTASGVVVLWPTEEEFPSLKRWGTIVSFAEGERDELEAFQTAFCRIAYDGDEPAFTHQDGTVYLFNWRSFTRAQLHVGSWVAKCHLDGNRNAAAAIGLAFQKMIDAARSAAQFQQTISVARSAAEQGVS